MAMGKMYKAKRNGKKPIEVVVRKKRSKRRANGPTKTIVPKRAFGFPDQYYCKLKYTDQITGQQLNSGNGYAIQKQWRLNQLDDIDITGTGHQPMYFDQVMANYTYYRVYGAKMKITIVNKTAQSPIYWTAYAGDDSAVALGVNRGAEQDNSIGLKVCGNVSGSRNIQTVTKYWSIAELAGVSKETVSESAVFSALVAGAVGQKYYCNLIFNASGSTTSDFDYAIQWTYYIRAENLLRQVAS